MTTTLTTRVELYENQRYSFGWKSSSLLPTDRLRYSTADGKFGWSTLADAEAAHKCIGWAPQSIEWSYPDGEGDEGWRYGSSFKGAVCCEHMPSEKGSLDFVRRRRLHRAYEWTGEGLKAHNYGGCGRVDSEIAEKVSAMLLNAIAHGLLLRAPSEIPAQVDIQLLCELKGRLCTYLGIAEEVNDTVATTDALASATNSGLRTSEASQTSNVADVGARCKNCGAILSLTAASEHECASGADALIAALNAGPLDAFAAGLLADRSAFEKLQSAVTSSMPNPATLALDAQRAASRAHVLDQPPLGDSAGASLLSGFTPKERAYLTTRALSYLDVRGGLARCADETCTGSDACPFATRTCPHAGCSASFALRHHERHDAQCRHKPVACAHGCGELVPRHAQAAHFEHACPNAPAPCPFAALGCAASLTRQEVPNHVEVAAQGHLLLAVNRISEHQGVIRQLAARVSDLEKTQHESENASSATAAAAAATTATLAKHQIWMEEHTALHAREQASAAAHNKQFAEMERKTGAVEALAKEAKTEAGRCVAKLVAAVAPAIKQLQDTVSSLSPNPSQADRQWRRLPP